MSGAANLGRAKVHPSWNPKLRSQFCVVRFYNYWVSLDLKLLNDVFNQDNNNTLETFGRLRKRFHGTKVELEFKVTTSCGSINRSLFRRRSTT